MKCSEAVKLAGFKTVAQVVKLSNRSKASMFVDFSDRKFKSNFADNLRRAMDAKHMRERAIQVVERAVMEAAIIEIMKKDVE